MRFHVNDSLAWIRIRVSRGRLFSMHLVGTPKGKGTLRTGKLVIPSRDAKSVTVEADMVLDVKYRLH
jgi:hypothetical protein